MAGKARREEGEGFQIPAVAGRGEIDWPIDGACWKFGAHGLVRILLVIAEVGGATDYLLIQYLWEE